MSKKIIIGTRGSALALKQAELLISNFSKLNSDIQFQIKVIKTTGDKNQSVVGPVERDKKDWVEEIERAIVKKEVDIALHSAKDIPVEIASETKLIPVCKRATPYDLAVFRNTEHRQINDLPNGAKVGTASLRRRSELLFARPDLSVVELRGNVPTRLQKMEAENFDAIILACAGMERLGFDEIIERSEILKSWISAVNQGILACQYLESREDLQEILSSLHDKDLEIIFLAERAVIRKLGADCKSAVGVVAELSDLKELTISCRIFSRDASQRLEESVTGSMEEPEILGTKLANKLLDRGASDFL